jgi:hypothetical protein
MTKSASVMVLSALAALSVAWLWIRRNEPPVPAPLETHTTRSAAPATPTTSVVAPAAVEDKATGSGPSPVEAHDDGAARTAAAIFDAFERGVTPTFVDYLVSKGLSSEDSEKIVGDAVRDMTRCVVDAMRVQTSASAVPLKVEAGSPPMALPEWFFSRRAGSCMLNVEQRIGLPPNVTFELRARDSTFELAARVPE